MAQKPTLKTRVVATCTERWLAHCESYFTDSTNEQFEAGCMHVYARVISEVTGESLADVKVALRALREEQRAAAVG